MKYGLIGEHLGHSFSKQIQTRIAEIVNVKDYDYQLVELNKEEFKITIIQEIKKLIKPLKTWLITNISLGKYTFLIIPWFDLIHVVPDVTTVAKNVQGIIPVTR